MAEWPCKSGKNMAVQRLDVNRKFVTFLNGRKDDNLVKRINREGV